MDFKFLAAFRQREDDEDHFSRLLRVLRATFCAISSGALWLVFQAAWFGEFRDTSLDHPLNGPLLFSTAIFVAVGSSRRDRELSASVHRCFCLSMVAVLALAAAEATTLLNWLHLEEMLGWWRRALLITAGAWFLLWAGEKAVKLSRSKREIA